MFSTPQRQTSKTTPSSQLNQQSQTPQETIDKGPETPKVGGRWTHPALPGIEKEARKFMFGEEELRRLIANTGLLIAIWWFTRKINDR